MTATESITCREFVDRSTDLLEGALPTITTSAMTSHSASCPDCSLYLEQVRTTIAWSAGVRFDERLTTQSRAIPTTLMHSEELLASVDCSILKRRDGFLFLKDRLSSREQVEALGHLIEGCSDCPSTLRKVAFPTLGSTARFHLFRGPNLSAPRSKRVGEYVLDTTARQQPSDLDRKLSSWQITREDFVLTAIQVGRTLVGDDAETAVEIADYVLELAENESPETRMRAHLLRGLAVRRSRGDFAEANDCFERATRIGEHHRCHPVLLAKALELRAVNLYDYSRTPEALEWSRKAAEILISESELDRLGRLLIDTSGAMNEARGPEEALRQRFMAATLIDFRRAPRYGFAIAQGCALSYVDLEQPDRALLMLDLMDRLPAQHLMNQSDRLRLRWTRGRVLSSMGRYEESAEVLERVRGEFLRSGSGAEVARVSLEAALAYVSSRRLPRAVELLGEGLAYFGSTRLDQEAAAAYLALRDALAMGRISGSALAASVMTLLERRAKHN